MKITLIDDDVTALDALQAGLKKRQHIITTFDNIAAAISFIEENPQDIVLCDVFMPEMDGFQVSLGLKVSLGNQAPAIILYTGYRIEPNYQHMAEICGAEMILSKPLELAELEAHFKTAINHKKPHRKEDFSPEAIQSIYEKINKLLSQHYNKALKNERITEQGFEALLELTTKSGDNEAQLIEHTVELCQKLTESKIAYWHYISDDQQRIEMIKWSKATEKGCQAAFDHHYPIAKAGIWADSVRKQTPVVHNDYPNYDGKKGLPEGHFYLSRHMSVPICDKGKVIAVIGVGNKEEPYNRHDVMRLQVFGERIWEIIKTNRLKDEMLITENNLRAIEKVARVGVWELDLKTQQIKWSDEVYDIFDIKDKTQAPTYEDFLEMIHPADRDIVAESYSQSIKRRQDYHARHRIIQQSSKTIKFVDERGKHIYNEDGEAIKSIGTVYDISPIIKAENRFRSALNGAISVLSKTLAVRDPYTARHQSNVTQIALEIARKLKFNHRQLEGLELAAEVHDIGKIYVPAEILNRPGKLTEAEMTIVKSHTKVGYDILKEIDFPWPVADIAHQHHEKLDGSGYPQGLTADQILPEAKVLAVADMFEAIVSHRPYRAAHPLSFALDILKKEKGRTLDEDAVDACLELIDKANPVFTKIISLGQSPKT